MSHRSQRSETSKFNCDVILRDVILCDVTLCDVTPLTNVTQVT